MAFQRVPLSTKPRQGALRGALKSYLADIILHTDLPAIYSKYP